MLDGTKFGNDTWINKWCKFEMDALEYYEGSQKKTKVTVTGIFHQPYIQRTFDRYDSLS